jgi:hypothetical protein
MAVYDDTNVEERIRVHDKAVLPGDDNGSGPRLRYHRGPTTAPVVPFEEPLAVQARHFVDCLSTGTPPPTGGASGLAVVQVIEADQLSLAEERKVHLAEVYGLVATAGAAMNSHGRFALAAAAPALENVGTVVVLAVVAVLYSGIGGLGHAPPPARCCCSAWARRARSGCTPPPSGTARGGPGCGCARGPAGAIPRYARCSAGRCRRSGRPR